MSVRTRLAAGAVAAAGAAALILAPAGDASAVTKTYPIGDCTNLSPNVVDMPYQPNRVFVSEYAGTVYMQITYGSLWLGLGYDSHARLAWKNLQTGRNGVLVDNSIVRPPNTGVHNFTVKRSTFGPGKVRLTLTTTNRNAVWAVPARTCTSTVVAP
ncbi:MULTISPECIES: hypothetical protein [Gordonia]|jgi:hypothetical protein|uniref:Uncharacterized protein n=1 Tax=Gordonia malaquae NBRC 108250 TaxID=1223542 RepID=M3VAR6_GORML|nr:hypothetical protein [Gordonia malaquae]GAC79093.1 hypothetical protein GM1_007_00520 [Gordonia malaquae NBRC 108250]SEE10459.1 hypothetical protein SAMN04488550_3845 [Gordonia malaquae]